MRLPKIKPDCITAAILTLDDIALELIDLAVMAEEDNDHERYDALIGLAGRTQVVAQDLIGEVGIN